MSLEIIVLAAGQGTRMRSARPKVLQMLAGRPLLGHVLATVRRLRPARIHVVIGHGADAVRAAFADAADVTWVHQAEQLGTGHAVREALPGVAQDSTLLVVYGDVPLVTEATLRGCIDAAHAGVALVTMRPPDPAGLGRIVRDRRGAVVAIVEEKDADSSRREINETNSGILAMPATLARELVAALDADNAQREFLLTDVVRHAVAGGVAVLAHETADAGEVAGVNDRMQLALLERDFQRRAAHALMQQGVTVYDPARIDIRGDVRAGVDSLIDVNVVLEGTVDLGERVAIGAGSVIRNSRIGNGVRIEPHSVIDGAEIGEDCIVGPFARLRPGTVLGPRVHIGNFVETKAAQIGTGSKANHLAYLGDVDIGEGSNIGAGTIVCNYDGVAKHRSEVGDGVFIGSNSTLVSPVVIAEGAFVAAGSTVTNKVDARELAIGRARQRNIAGWKPPSQR
jgi:bifunctional UDP-N-acetylglucosamine pyrophosphorylase / glucosamine-1-phosphate N-acetyltransferase